MEVVDELMTPGCPNCALKHLSAALQKMVDKKNYVDPVTPVDMLLSRAYINIVEAKEGYHSHLPYAIGLLVTAEEKLIRLGNSELAGTIRGLRTGIMLDDPKSLHELWLMALPRLARAHFAEALRELPVLSENFGDAFPSYDQNGIDTIMKMITWIRNEFFTNFEPITVKEEKGDEIMACAKKSAPKAAAATKAACKGGKCAGSKKSCKK